MKNEETTMNKENRNSRIPTENDLRNSTFLKRLLQSPEEQEEKARLYKTKQAFLNLEQDILANEQAIDAAEEQLEALKMAANYEPTAIVAMKMQIKQMYEGLEGLYELRKEDFGI